MDWAGIVSVFILRVSFLSTFLLSVFFFPPSSYFGMHIARVSKVQVYHVQDGLRPGGVKGHIHRVVSFLFRGVGGGLGHGVFDCRDTPAFYFSS